MFYNSPDKTFFFFISFYFLDDGEEACLLYAKHEVSRRFSSVFVPPFFSRSRLKVVALSPGVATSWLLSVSPSLPYIIPPEETTKEEEKKKLHGIQSLSLDQRVLLRVGLPQHLSLIHI